MYNAAPIVLYEYQKTRNTSYPREFLKNYSGTVVTDRYQVYHSLEKEREDLRIAGCWSHSRRRFANVVKALGKEKANNLKPYNYFELLLTEISKYMEDTNLDFLNDLLPWSENLPVECKKENQ